MGDRANIIVKENKGSIHLYTHWQGYRIREILAAALDRGRSRWDDTAYLIRIIFCEMISGENADETTGFGISTDHCEPGNDLWVDPEHETVRAGTDTLLFDEFIEKHK